MAAEYLERVGARIRERREEKGLSQAALARALPGTIDGNQVSRWERGKHRPNDETLQELAKILGVDVAYFLAAQAQKSNGTPDPFAGTSDLAETLELIQRQLEVNGEALEVLLGGLANGGVAEEPQLEAALNHLVELRRYVEAHRQTA